MSLFKVEWWPTVDENFGGERSVIAVERHVTVHMHASPYVDVFIGRYYQLHAK